MTRLRIAGLLLLILALPLVAHAKKPRPSPIEFYTVLQPAETIGPLIRTSISVSCTDGDEVVSGGYIHTADLPDLKVLGSFPFSTGTWVVEIQNFSPVLPGQIALFARCSHFAS